jgi:FAD/FMN-containing dehydrogenase
VIGHIDALNEENDRVVLWWMLPPAGRRDKVVLITKNAVGGARGGALERATPASRVLRKRLPKDAGELRKVADAAPARGFQKVIQYVGDYEEVLTIPLLPVFHRECEYAIPVENTVKALQAFRAVVEEGDLSLTLPVEVRFVAADDILLSPCHGRAQCYIGASTLLNSSEVFERFEPIMKSLGGRPHWGKNATVTQAEVAAMYPTTYDRFRAVRDRFDPRRVFTNTMLSELIP